MHVYTVLTRQKPDGSYDPEEAIFVIDSFSWAAFLLGPLWLVSHGHWRALLVWTVFFVAILAAGHYGGIAPGQVLVLVLAAGLFLGLQASTLRETSLMRRQYRIVGLVAGATLHEAERIFFRRWLSGPGQRPFVRPVSSSESDPAPSPVLGLFPLPEGRS